MRPHRIAMMLAERGVCVADMPPPLFKYGTPNHDHLARLFVPFIECGFSDREAYHARFSDEQRLSFFRDAHGNRKGKRKPKPQPSLFPAVGGSGTGGDRRAGSVGPEVST